MSDPSRSPSPSKPDRPVRLGPAAAPGEGASESGLSERLLGGGSLDLRIAADGTWLHEGRPIRRPALVKLFSTVLRREDDGSYWLVTPAERGRVTVEDAPFLAVALRREGEGRSQCLAFRTNLDEWVELDAAHPLRITEKRDSGEPRPYILVRPGLEARILRPVFYELAELAEPAEPEEQGGEERLGLWSKGIFFSLAPR